MYTPANGDDGELKWRITQGFDSGWLFKIKLSFIIRQGKYDEAHIIFILGICGFWKSVNVYIMLSALFRFDMFLNNVSLNNLVKNTLKFKLFKLVLILIVS